MQCIKTIRWFSYKIPFRSSFTTAHGVLTAREGAIVEVVTENNLSGIGEIAPLPSSLAMTSLRHLRLYLHSLHNFVVETSQQLSISYIPGHLNCLLLLSVAWRALY